jgi:lysyl-tRNA synthetase class 2
VSKQGGKSDGGKERVQRLLKLEKLRGMGINPYPYVFERTHSIREASEAEKDLQEKETKISVTGRVMALRKHGHTAFGNVKDGTGALQFYIRDDQVEKRLFELFELVDIGDLLGITGTLFRTRTGELTVKVIGLELLGKALLPLPEKWHGLQNKEIRYRRRYVDLVVNDEVAEIFRMRSRIVETIRQFLLEHEFLEVETPILQPLYGGAMARPFVTHHNALDIDLYLRIADELYLKRLVVGGLERVFEFSKDFRNEGMDRSHNPEFTMLECYAAYWDYLQMMDFVEALFSRLCDRILGGYVVKFQGTEIDLSPPWKRSAFFELLSEATGLDMAGMDEAGLEKVCGDRDLDTGGVAGRGGYLDLLFSELVEPNLIQPTFVMDYPIELSPLAKTHRSEPGLVERFEPYICGFEVGNAFSELNDPLDQRERFEHQARMRAAGAEEVHPIDEDYIRALEYGMPPTGGLGIGIDRVVMLLTDSLSIRDVIFFPQMRPEEGLTED